MRHNKLTHWLNYFILAASLALIPISGLAVQTCYGEIIATTPDSRFTVHGDGTVTDLRTGLMWKQCNEGLSGSNCSGTSLKFTWQEALQKAETLNAGAGFAGYTDWRLPNIKELDSIVELSCQSPSINETVFPNTPTDTVNYFWSSSLAGINYYGQPAGDAWNIKFNFGFSITLPRVSTIYVRLVRGG